MGFVTPFMWSHTDPGSERPALMQDGIFQYVDVGTGKMEILKHEMDPAFETGLNIAERKGRRARCTVKLWVAHAYRNGLQHV